MKTKLGSQLHPEDQQHVLRAFVHRFTADHKPSWAQKPMPNGNPYKVQFSSDADWLAHTYFRVTTSGRLDRRATTCQSNPTWPNNPELRGKL